MTPSLEGSPTEAKEALSPHEVRLATLDTNPELFALQFILPANKNFLELHIQFRNGALRL